MATVQVTSPITDGPLVHAADVNAITATATVTNIVNADLAASMKDGVAGTATARSLGTGAQQACAGNDSRLAASPATQGLKFGTNAVIPLNSTQPGVSTFLMYNGSSIVGASPSGSAEIDLTGTVSTTSASVTVLGVGTIFETEIQIGYLIKINGVTRRVVSVASDTALNVNAAWGADNTTVAGTFIITTQRRPWNDRSAKGGAFAVALTDVGVLFECDTSTASFAVTLCAASGFQKGDSVAFVKVTDDAHSISINCAGTDTFTDGSTSLVFSSFGGSVTIVSDGIGVWRVVASERLPGAIIQRIRNTDAAKQTLTTAISSSAAPTIASGTGIAPLTVLITPKSAKSKIRVRALIPLSSGNSAIFISALVFSSIAGPTDTLRAISTSFSNGGKQTVMLPIEAVFDSGTTDQITVTLRVGPSSNTLYYLGDTNGATLFGGLSAFIEVTEEAI